MTWCLQVVPSTQDSTSCLTSDLVSCSLNMSDTVKDVQMFVCLVSGEFHLCDRVRLRPSYILKFIIAATLSPRRVMRQLSMEEPRMEGTQCESVWERGRREPRGVVWFTTALSGWRASPRRWTYNKRQKVHDESLKSFPQFQHSAGDAGWRNGTNMTDRKVNMGEKPRRNKDQ